MPEQVNGWLAQGGTALTSVVALAHGSLLGGITLLVVGSAVAIKLAGPELREWRLMGWTRKDSQRAADLVLQTPQPEVEQTADAA